MKYAVCGPKTAIGLPFRVCSPAISSALLVAFGIPRTDGPFASVLKLRPPLVF